MDLLEVFGGRDNLELMCGATRFHKEARNRISFRFDAYRIKLTITVNTSAYSTISMNAYRLEIFDVVSGLMVGHAYTTDKDFLRERFEEYTGYSLSF